MFARFTDNVELQNEPVAGVHGLIDFPSIDFDGFSPIWPKRFLGGVGNIHQRHAAEQIAVVPPIVKDHTVVLTRAANSRDKKRSDYSGAEQGKEDEVGRARPKSVPGHFSNCPSDGDVSENGDIGQVACANQFGPVNVM